jgi:dTDP-4-dehydrorhamnose reductase
MKRMLITGGSGFIGGNLALRARSSWDVAATYRATRPNLDSVNWIEMDLTDEKSVQSAVASFRPDVIVHLAAMSDIERCETEQDLCEEVNVQGTVRLAEAAFDTGARLIFVSTDNVFDGERGSYAEDDAPNPVNFYGRSKVMAEEAVRSRSECNLVVRIPVVLGFPALSGANSFLSSIVKLAREDKKVWFITSEVRSPIDVTVLCDVFLELAEDGHEGLLHVGGTEALDRGLMGERILDRLGKPRELGIYLRSRDGGAKRPRDVSLNVTKATASLRNELPDFSTSLDRSFEHCPPERLTQ